jgi:hypothetical protein
MQLLLVRSSLFLSFPRRIHLHGLQSLVFSHFTHLFLWTHHPGALQDLKVHFVKMKVRLNYARLFQGLHFHFYLFFHVVLYNMYLDD